MQIFKFIPLRVWQESWLSPTDGLSETIALLPPTIEEFSKEELLNAANKMNNNKAPGPDGILNVVVKVESKLNQCNLSISITSVY